MGGDGGGDLGLDAEDLGGLTLEDFGPGGGAVRCADELDADADVILLAADTAEQGPLDAEAAAEAVEVGLARVQADGGGAADDAESGDVGELGG